MQKVLESVLVIIVFYGVFSAFTRMDEYFQLDYPVIAIALAALLFSAGLLLMYAGVIRREMKQKLQGDIKDLKKQVKHKDHALKDAFKVKKSVEDEAEATIEDANNSDGEV